MTPPTASARWRRIGGAAVAVGLMTVVLAVARPATDVIRFRLPVTSAAEWAKLGETGIVLTIVSDRAASTVRRPRP